MELNHPNLRSGSTSAESAFWQSYDPELLHLVSSISLLLEFRSGKQMDEAFILRSLQEMIR